MLKLALAVLTLALAAGVLAAPAAYAEHPDDDDAWRTVLEGQPWSGDPDDAERDNPICDAANDDGEYLSIDFEFWICKPDPGLPEVPGSGGWYWEPVSTGYDDPAEVDPDSPDDVGGDVEWAKKWVPVTIPGYPGVVMRMLTRTEWVNPTGVGRCPNVTGGCQLKGGADINFRRNGVPFQLSKTWFNRALQLYTYNFTTHAWVLRQDTGWTYAGAAAAAYLSSWTKTLNYGVAPYGDTWYWVRDQTRVWNGSAWQNFVLDPNPGPDGHLGIVDPKPGASMDIPPVSEKTKPPKVKPPKEKGLPVIGAPTS
jgi:hypothetical protein